MAEKKVVILKDGQEIDTRDVLTGYSISEGYEVRAYSEGSVISAGVYEGGVLQALGGEVSKAMILQGGLFEAQAGTVDDTLVLEDGQFVVQGTTVSNTSIIGGTASVQKEGMALGTFVSGDGIVEVLEGGFASDLTMFAGTVSLSGGYGSAMTIQGGLLNVSDGAFAYEVCLPDHSAAFVVSEEGMILNSELDGASGDIQAGGIAVNSELWSYYNEDEPGVIYSATLTLHAGAWHYGTLFIDSKSTLVAEEGSVIDFTLEGSTASANALLNDFTRISGTPTFTMTVSEEQAAGTYALAGNAAAFSTPLFVCCGDYAPMLLDAGDAGTYHNSVYSLEVKDGTLTAAVEDFATTASAEKLTWGGINGAESYELQLANGRELLSLEVSTTGVDLLGLADGDYAWRVRNAAEADNWQNGGDFSQTAESSSPHAYVAETNDATDLFFAKTDGAWKDGYCAENVFTKERIALQGKLRVTDIFAGSDDASVLTCSVPEAQASGVALFLDDIYSPAEGASEQARLSRIDTILATVGDDIVDLTSTRFGFADGVAVYGGAGDDVLWGGGEGCSLFGGDGNDRLAGTAGNDLLVGGAGDDVIQCLGGEDILCFGSMWGGDTVMQEAGGRVTLWLAQGDESKWDAESMVYSDGVNSIRVAGGVSSSDVTLKFGDDGSERYARLLSQGALLA